MLDLFVDNNGKFQKILESIGRFRDQQVEERLNSFLKQIRLYDEDSKDRDDNLLLVSEEKDGVYAYPLGKGWRVYWMFVRKPSPPTSLRLTKITGVYILGIVRVQEWERPR